MEEDIMFWKGTRVEELSREDLIAALAEVYRDYERVSWELHRQAKGGGKKPKRDGQRLTFVPSKVAA